jgi:hypothetical protein
VIVPISVFPIPTEAILEVHTFEDYYYLLTYLLTMRVNASMVHLGDHCELILDVLGELLGDIYEDHAHAHPSIPLHHHDEYRLFDEYFVRYEQFDERMQSLCWQLIATLTAEQTVELEQLNQHPFDPNAVIITFSVE